MCFSVCPALCLLGAMSSAAGESRQFVVEMQIPNIVNTPMSFAFLRARGVVADIFSAIGVTVEWRGVKAQSPGCSGEPMRRTILVAFSENTPPQFHARALAIANPYSTGGACITIFTDRLRPMLAMNPRITEALLGHLLAHEMGHVLQRVARHSETGVLKAGWPLAEVSGMLTTTLRFTPYDREMIFDSMRHSPGPPAGFIPSDMEVE